MFSVKFVINFLDFINMLKAVCKIQSEPKNMKT